MSDIPKFYECSQCNRLAAELAGEQKKFRRTIAMLVIAAGGSIRVSMLDYLKAEEAGVIQSWTDPKTNDQVYTVGVTAPEKPGES